MSSEKLDIKKLYPVEYEKFTREMQHVHLARALIEASVKVVRAWESLEKDFSSENMEPAVEELRAAQDALLAFEDDMRLKRSLWLMEQNLPDAVEALKNMGSVS